MNRQAGLGAMQPEVGSRRRFPSGSKAGPVAAFLLQEKWIAVPSSRAGFLEGARWDAVGSALNLLSLSSVRSQTSCCYGTGFAEPRGSCQQDRRLSRHCTTDSPCPKDELALWQGRCKGLRPQHSSITNR